MSITHSPNTDLIESISMDQINKKISEKTDKTIHEVENKGLKSVRERLKKLESEWDIDKVTNASFASLIVFELLTARRKTKWFIIAQLIQLPIFLMNKKLGIYSPSIIFRILGFRTKKEIELERKELIKFLDRSYPYEVVQNNTH
jgi:pilus assembly protein TadC